MSTLYLAYGERERERNRGLGYMYISEGRQVRAS